MGIKAIHHHYTDRVSYNGTRWNDTIYILYNIIMHTQAKTYTHNHRMQNQTSAIYNGHQQANSTRQLISHGTSSGLHEPQNTQERVVSIDIALKEGRQHRHSIEGGHQHGDRIKEGSLAWRQHKERVISMEIALREDHQHGHRIKGGSLASTQH